MHNQIIILGVPVDNLTMPETLDELERFIEIGRATGRSHQIATVNADFITNALDDPEVLALLQKTDLNMPDGMPIVWGARLLGAPIRERVAGVDAILHLSERAAQKGYSIYFLGAAPGVAVQAAETIRQTYPGVKIAGVSSPMIPANAETDPCILEEIKAARPDILLVALGNPKQEKWIGAYGGQLHVPLMIGVGGTLDLISGHKIRAPKWMRGSGLEWTFRLAQEPKRLWRRYQRNIFVFGPQFIRQWWKMRARPRLASSSGVEEVIFVNNAAVASLCGSLSIDNILDFEQSTRKILAKTSNILLDCSQADLLDSSAFGALLRLARQARCLGGDLMLAGVSEEMAYTLRVLRLENFFHIFPDLRSVLKVILPHRAAERLQEFALYWDEAIRES